MLKEALIPIKNDSRPGMGATLRGKRKEIGLSMPFVADEARLTVGFINQLERGITRPLISSLVPIAEVLITPITAVRIQHGTIRQVKPRFLDEAP